jgi:hypothetical protein
VLETRRVINRNKYIEKNLCITLVIYQESLHDARSTKCKIFKKWLQEKLIPNLESKSFTVVDNASYHNVQFNRHPPSNATKGEIVFWFDKHGILTFQREIFPLTSRQIFLKMVNKISFETQAPTCMITLCHDPEEHDTSAVFRHSDVQFMSTERRHSRTEEEYRLNQEHFFRNPLQLMIHATVQKLYSRSY